MIEMGMKIMKMGMQIKLKKNNGEENGEGQEN